MIKKRGRVFWLDLWVGKNRLRRSLKTTERTIAIERARDLTLELRKPKPPGTPLAEFAEKYNAWARTAKPAYSRTERYLVGAIKSWFNNEGLSTLESITPHDVERFRAYLLTKNVGHTTKTVSRPTVNRYCALLRTMFNKARDWGGYRGDNPVSRVKFYREGGKVKPLDKAEVERILEAADALAAAKHATPLQREFPAVCRLILQTGLRRSEAFGLQWSSVGDDGLTICGKGGKIRSVPLNLQARAIIERRRRDGVFVFDVPGRSSPSLLRRITATIGKNTGVAGFHVHLLRHRFASDLLAAGVDVVTISQLLGHSAYMTTLLYSHSNPGLMRQAVEAIQSREMDTGRKIKKRK